jgi:hypothetical protein
MAIKLYDATQDNTITNAFKADLLTRATGSNMGAADILETFVIHGQTSASINSQTAEEARVLLQFDIANISTDRANGVIPASGSVNFILKVRNAKHADTLPDNLTLDIKMVANSWDEGRGVDMDGYKDIDECNWVKRTSGATWNGTGSDYFTAQATSNFSGSVLFPNGDEDMEIDVTPAVEDWIAGTRNNYGFIIKNTDSAISGNVGSLFTKRFHARSTEFFMKRPVIEAQWDDSTKDQRANFFLSSSALSAADNLNTLFLYNRFRGNLTNISGLTNDALSVSFYTASSGGAPIGSPVIVTDATGSSVTKIECGREINNGVRSTGIYTASFAITSSDATLFDVWFTGSTEFFTGSFKPQSYTPNLEDRTEPYFNKITNLKPTYNRLEKPRLRVFARPKRWQPTIYTVASVDVENTIVEDAYYKIFRIEDNIEVVSYGTGTMKYSRLSYDVSGNYFDLDMSPLEAGYSYGIQLAYYLQGQYKEQAEIFKFRIEEP